MCLSTCKNVLRSFYACLLLAVCFSPAEAAPLRDTTYYDYINIRGIPYDIIVKLKAEFYEVSLRGPQIYAHIDSAKGNQQLIIDSFDRTTRETATRQLPLDFTEALYSSRVKNLLLAQLASPSSIEHLATMIGRETALNTELRLSYQRIKGHFLSKVVEKRIDSIKVAKEEEVRELNKGHKRTIDSLLNIIDVVDEENKYGGQFEFADKDSAGVLIYRIDSLKPLADTIRFFPNNIMVRTFNNFIDLIHVDGVVVVGKKQYPVRCYNSAYSIPLKHIYIRNQYLVFSLRDSIGPRGWGAAHDNTWRYFVNVSDLISINAYRNHFTFMVKDDAYVLSRHKDSLVEPYYRKSIYDYLSVTTFLDFLGVMEKTPNSLIQIEGRVRLPLRLNNTKLFGRFNNVFIPKIDAYLNAAFINGSQPDNRFGTVFSASANPTSDDTLYIDQFDLVRKYNISTGMELGLYKRELRSWNLNFYIDYALRFWRTGLRYTIVDTSALDQLDQFNAWSWAHGPVFRIEYRPDLNIGADLTWGFDLNQRILNSDNANLFVTPVKGPLNKNVPQIDPFAKALGRSDRTNYKLELNVYYMVNPRRSNGGLYFRLSNYFSSNFKQSFPQVLVGYSTRLSGMINNITKKTNND